MSKAAWEDGRVIRLQSGFYTVHTAAGVVMCGLRGRLKRNTVRADTLAVGDRVLYAARLYRLGVAPKMLLTGGNLDWSAENDARAPGRG